jgi:hypothetical protein
LIPFASTASPCPPAKIHVLTLKAQIKREKKEGYVGTRLEHSRVEEEKEKGGLPPI